MPKITRESLMDDWKGQMTENRDGDVNKKTLKRQWKRKLNSTFKVEINENRDKNLKKKTRGKIF